MGSVSARSPTTTCPPLAPAYSASRRLTHHCASTAGMPGAAPTSFPASVRGAGRLPAAARALSTDFLHTRHYRQLLLVLRLHCLPYFMQCTPASIL